MIRNIDPVYFVLKKLICAKFFKSNLEKEELLFLEDNINKHRKVLWINFFGTILIYFALANSSTETLIAIISALIAPAMLTGTAWFAVSFGGVPTKLIDIAMSTTLWMFTAFTLSILAMFMAVSFLSPVILLPVLWLIYLGILVSCIQYDNADGLKAGLDDALLKHSRAALIYYKKRGIDVEHQKTTKNIKK